MKPDRLLVCQDLIFSTKITGTARLVGVEIAVCPHIAAALAACDDQTQMVIVDLSSPASTTAEELRTLRERLGSDARLIAYGSHVDVDRLAAARTAGCDPVLPRSEFTKRLAELLTG